MLEKNTVEVSYTDNEGNLETVFSEETDHVTNPNDVDNTPPTNINNTSPEGYVSIKTVFEKPDWSVIEGWFNQRQSVLSIDDGSALLSSNKDITSDHIITFSANLDDLSVNREGTWLTINGETLTLERASSNRS